MNSRIWPIISMLLLLSLALGAASCAPSAATPTPMLEEETETGEPYRIGVIAAITGHASSLGTSNRDSIQMLEKEVNAAGGIRGPDGLWHLVEVIYYDTESDETKALLATKKLIEQDQVSVILGPSQSGTTLAIIDTMQKAEVPLISMASSVKIIEPVEERYWIFKSVIVDRVFAKHLLSHVQRQGITKIAWMSVNTGYGESGRGEVEAAAPDFGITIVTSERFESSDTDMTAQLTSIRGTDAEGLVVWGLPPAASILMKNAFDLGFEMPIFQSAGAGNEAFLELAGKEAVEGMKLSAYKILVGDQLPESDPQKAVMMDYIQDHQAAYGRPPNTFGACGWDAFTLAVRAMEKAGADRARIRDELERLPPVVGISGIFELSASDHVGVDERGLAIVEIVDGQWKFVE